MSKLRAVFGEQGVVCLPTEKNAGDAVTVSVNLKNTGEMALDVFGAITVTNPDGTILRAFDFTSSVAIGETKTITAAMIAGELKQVGDYAVQVEAYQSGPNILLDRETCSALIRVLQPPEPRLEITGMTAA